MVSFIQIYPCNILFTYWHSYVEDDMSMVALDWTSSIIIPFTRINKIYPKLSFLFKVIHAISSSHIGTHMWKTICPWLPWIEQAPLSYPSQELTKSILNGQFYSKWFMQYPLHILALICGRRYVHGCLGLNRLHHHILHKN